jgi:hypothetical protein
MLRVGLPPISRPDGHGICTVLDAVFGKFTFHALQ